MCKCLESDTVQLYRGFLFYNLGPLLYAKLVRTVDMEKKATNEFNQTMTALPGMTQIMYKLLLRV